MKLRGKYGFREAFNVSYEPSSGAPGRFDDYLATDEGPILMMIENYRTGSVRDLIKRNEHIRTGLRRAGFEGGWLDAFPAPMLSAIRPVLQDPLG